jgi:hypothetical protein
MTLPVLRTSSRARPPKREKRPASGVVLAAAVAAVLAGCSEDDLNPVGAGALPPLGDPIQEVVLEPVVAESFLTGTADRAFGGVVTAATELPDASGFESRILLRFALALADSGIAITVDSAKVRLTYPGLEPDSVLFRLHRVTAEWLEEEVSWEERSFGVPWSTPGGDFDPQSVVQGTLAGDSAAFAIPDSLAQSWIDTPESNEGLILLLDTPRSWAQVTASSTTTLPNELGPRLDLFVTRGDTASTSQVLATADAQITTYRGEIRPGLVVGNEPFFRSVLRFDLSAIPADASINLAELTLTPRQVVSPVDSLNLEARRVVSPLQGPATVFSSGDNVFDFVGLEPVLADSAVVLSAANLATLVRVWQSDSTLNQGLGLQALRRFGNLGFAVFAGADAAPADRPRLRIIFTPALEPDLGATRR